MCHKDKSGWPSLGFKKLIRAAVVVGSLLLVQYELTLHTVHLLIIQTQRRKEATLVTEACSTGHIFIVWTAVARDDDHVVLVLCNHLGAYQGMSEKADLRGRISYKGTIMRPPYHGNFRETPYTPIHLLAVRAIIVFVCQIQPVKCCLHRLDLFGYNVWWSSKWDALLRIHQVTANGLGECWVMSHQRLCLTFKQAVISPRSIDDHSLGLDRAVALWV